MHFFKKITLYLSLAALGILASCSFYQVGLNKPDELQEVQSLYIATPLVSINPTITQAPIYLKNQLSSKLIHKTAYALTNQKSADATLIIQVTDQNTRTLQQSDDNLLRGTAYKITLKSTWKVVQDNQTILSGNINEEALFVSQDPKDTSSLTTLNRSSWALAHQEAVKQALEGAANKLASELTIKF